MPVISDYVDAADRGVEFSELFVAKILLMT